MIVHTKDNVNDLSIVQHNHLIESSYQLDFDEMRLINLALTKVDSRQADVGLITIYPDEFYQMIQLPKKNIWRNMKKSLESIMNKSVSIDIQGENESNARKSISWFRSIKYCSEKEDGCKIELTFSDEIAPYLFNLTGNFTKVNFEFVRRLTTPFSFRLYQWLRQEYKMQKGGYYTLNLPIKLIKKRAGYDSTTYPKWRDFKSRVINPAIDAINQRTNFSVNYSVIRKGKRFYELTFIFIDELEKASNLLNKRNIYELPVFKPIRPRLHRRPMVKSGSHEEGQWQRKNLKLLTNYLTDLKTWDPLAKLTIADLKKIISYSKIFNQDLHEKMKQELLERQVTK